MKKAVAAMKATRAALARTQLVAPVTGIVVARAAEVGREITAGGDPPFLVASDLGVVRIEARVDAAFARDRKLGDTLSFRVDDIPGIFQGEIIGMSWTHQAGNPEVIRLVLSSKNSDRLLRQGTSVKIHFD